MPISFWMKLNLKLITLNDRDTLIPNLWCFCNTSIDPTILSISSQFVAISYVVDNIPCGIAAVYASTSYISRRILWNELTDLHDNFKLPWYFIGDFNTILGMHEYHGTKNPNHLPMDDFSNWTSASSLVHLPTIGAKFTWANGRKGRDFTQKRLDRVICNIDVLSSWSSISCSTLTKHPSDHCPLLLDITNVSRRFPSTFKFLKIWTTHSTCKDVILKAWSTHLSGCPMIVFSQKLKQVKQALKDWNKSFW